MILQRKDRRQRSSRRLEYDSIPYRVLTHDEWAAEHPNCCRFPAKMKIKPASKQGLLMPYQSRL